MLNTPTRLELERQVRDAWAENDRIRALEDIKVEDFEWTSGADEFSVYLTEGVIELALSGAVSAAGEVEFDGIHASNMPHSFYADFRDQGRCCSEAMEEVAEAYVKEVWQQECQQ